ncbi:MAG: bifunctional 5,10-methylene-tetrahydrofolate dehydrogenase/5,10-methylene-tetrahydrofolate cyclohydrolase [Chitinispirillaceae bacterium]|jgi:methylenetetrahydrofolate dehydrogenase (NADP+)/methenyltetrahydrofolate cyclohydrolase|nr:bifunctional 5,10-methylene-tetrahydrofolate dehydrogenase/5,10-methylene-tetrahydrofolate cyclohydrolase [Chitinispirillaceae bacterium]
MTSPLILDGKALARTMEEVLAKRVAAYIAAGGLTPVLATILVGSDPSSAIYVKMKGNACTRVGMSSRKIHLPDTTTTDELLNEIFRLNDDPQVHGILLQHPVPKQIDERACFDAIALGKDVDGVTTHGFGRMAMGEAAFGSATPAGIMKLLEHYKIPLEGRHAAVVGRSPILGKPMALMLLNKNATVTICHSHTRELLQIVSQADIVVGAVGRPKFIKADWIKQGAVIIDAGYHAGGVGDVDLEAAASRCSAYTPVPGGVGPMTIAMLMQQTMDAAEKGAGRV